MARERIRSFPEAWERVVDRLYELLPSLLAALVLLVVFWYVARLSVRLVRRFFDAAAVEQALKEPAVQLVRAVLLTLGVLAAASQLGLQVGSLIAGLGVAGLAVSLAAQETLSNLIAGFVVLWDRPFAVGDWITVGATYGEVTEIGLRSTRIRTLDEHEAILPNREMINQRVLNHSRYPVVRLAVPLVVDYGEEIERVRGVLLGAVGELPFVLAEPAPQLAVLALGDSGVQLELRLWTSQAERQRGAQWTAVDWTKQKLAAAGVRIPFPQRTVHFGSSAAPPPAAVATPG